MSKPLKNRRHEKLAQNIVKENFNLTEAYTKTYPHVKRDTARANVHRIIKDPLVQNRIQELAHESELTPRLLVEKLKQGLDAEKPLTYEGELIGTFPDYASRLEAIKVGLKLYGVGVDQSGEGITNNTNIQINLMDAERFNGTLIELKELSSQAPPDAEPC